MNDSPGQEPIVRRDRSRHVAAAMNRRGELTAVEILPPDPDFEPQGWEWRAAALTDLVNALHRDVAADGRSPA